MHPYVPYLLQDIAGSFSPEENKELLPEVSLEEGFEDIERFSSLRTYSKTFGEYCGLDIAEFPPPDQLNDSEMKMITQAFKEMALSWNQFIDLPTDLTTAANYLYTVNFLRVNTTIVRYGLIHYAPVMIQKCRS